VFALRSFAERHMVVTGFCSCKIGIHVIVGNNLGSTIRGERSEQIS
jgi:hypothetical protein